MNMGTIREKVPNKTKLATPPPPPLPWIRLKQQINSLINGFGINLALYGVDLKIIKPREYINNTIYL